MSQIKMVCENLIPADVSLRDGFRIIDSSSKLFTKREFSKQWANACEQLNRGYDEKLYESMMLSDDKIPEDGIHFVMASYGHLISTATVQMTDDPIEAYLHMVGTRRNARNLGGGHAVCAACVNYAIAHGIRRMRLFTDEFRLPAIKIYYGLGFRPDFYEPDMRERWNGVMKTLGWSEYEAVNENGKPETIQLC